MNVTQWLCVQPLQSLQLSSCMIAFPDCYKQSLRLSIVAQQSVRSGCHAAKASLKEKLANHHYLQQSTFPVQSRIYHFQSTSFFRFYLRSTPKKLQCCTFLLYIPPHVLITFYLLPPPPDHCLCTSPTYGVASAPFHQKDVAGHMYASITPHLQFQNFQFTPIRD